MAKVSQRFIDLLNVPLEVLRAIGDEKKVVGAASMTKWPLAKELDSLPRSDLEGLTAGFLYAGRTSVTFFRLDEPPKKPDAAEEDVSDAAAGAEQAPTDAAASAATQVPVLLEGEAVAPAEIEAALGRLSTAGDPFSEANRPDDVTRDPQLVVARRRDDGSILMTFVTEGPTAYVIHNFTVEPVVVDEFFSAVIYPEIGLVEVRTNQQNAARFGRSWLSTFAEELSRAAITVSITPADFKALADELDAGTTRFRGKNTSGGAVDTIEISMAPGHATLRGSIYFVTPAPRVRPRREGLPNPCLTHPRRRVLRR